MVRGATPYLDASFLAAAIPARTPFASLIFFTFARFAFESGLTVPRYCPWSFRAARREPDIFRFFRVTLRAILARLPCY